MNTDRITVQMVVAFIGLSSLLIVGGLIFLAYQGRPIPEQLSTMGGAAIGTLGSLLARTFTSEGLGGTNARAASPEANGAKNSLHPPVPVVESAPIESKE